MYDLARIIKQNQEAVDCGLIKAGTAVGTVGYRPGDVHPQSIAAPVDTNYPWSIEPIVVDGVTRWVVCNLGSGFRDTVDYALWDNAEARLSDLKSGAL